MGKRKDNATSPRQIKLVERQAEALEYRKQGHTYAAIGEVMEITDSYAHELVAGALAKMIREPGENVLAIELARLDDLTVGVMIHAVKGDGQAIDRVLAIAQRRAKLLGIDAPEKQEHTGKAGGPLQVVIAAADSNL